MNRWDSHPRSWDVQSIDVKVKDLMDLNGSGALWLEWRKGRKSHAFCDICGKRLHDCIDGNHNKATIRSFYNLCG
jgi:hypothetical protein